MAAVSERVYMVDGMTCGHCAAAVQEEVAGVAGVSAVTADVETGRVVVTGADVSDDAVARAVDEAGYTVRR